MIEDFEGSIKPFHYNIKNTELNVLSLKALDMLLGLSIFKSIAKPYDLLKKLTGRGSLMTQVAHSLLLPLLKPVINNREDAFILEMTFLHYIKKIAKQYSTPTFKISCISAVDCEMLLNSRHQESKALKQTLKESDLIIWPIGYKKHAHLIAFHLSKGTQVNISILDSNNSRSINEYLLTKAKPIAKCIKGMFAAIHYKHYTIPQQSAGYDCAAACSYFAKALCLRADLGLFSTVSQPVNYTEFRLEIASMCCDFNVNLLDQGIYLNLE